MEQSMRLKISELAEQIGARLAGSGDVSVSGVGSVDGAGPDEITFAFNEQHLSRLDETLAAAVIVPRRQEGLSRPQLIVDDVRKALIEVLGIFAPKIKAVAPGIDPGARLAHTVKLGEDVCIGAGVIAADGVEIGDGSVISSGCKIGENTRIGKNCRLDCNVVVYHNCVIGNNVIIQANSTIGSTGFGYYTIDGRHQLIPHNGGVLIEDFVEIGANCCIDRAKFGNTVIGAGTKIDNLVQVAHNVVIGKLCLLAGQCGLGGSSTLSDGVVLAGQSGIIDHIEVGQGAMVGAKSAVISNVGAGEKIFGVPATDSKKAMASIAMTRRLPKLRKEISSLKQRVKELEAAKDDKD